MTSDRQPPPDDASEDQRRDDISLADVIDAEGDQVYAPVELEPVAEPGDEPAAEPADDDER